MDYKNEELIAALRDAEDRARMDVTNEERLTLLKLYNGEPLGNEVQGRSTIVDRSVFEVIEWIKPSLLKIFCSGDEVVNFVASDASDEEQAQQETDYVNHVVMQKNNAVVLFHNWFHDALLMKNGYVKAHWDETETLETERYQGLLEPELAYILQDQSIEVIGSEQTFDEMGNPVFNVEVRKKLKRGTVKLTNLPPEQVLVAHSHSDVDVANADFVQFWDFKTLSELRQMGFDVPDDVGDEFSSISALEWERISETNTFNPSMDGYGDSGRRVRVRESWIRYDDNGDGKSELLHLITLGNEILLKEDADEIPIACICPIPLPHRHIGLSVAESVEDIQVLKTQLTRGFVDNLALANNGRYAISDRVNLSDMLTSRPGGVVRVQGEPGNAILPLVHPMVGPSIVQGLEYINSMSEKRSGITAYNQGLDANSLNKTATGVTQIMSASQQRIEMIARIFAEGVKRLFLTVHKLTKQNATQPEVLRLRGKWVPVDPRTWKNRFDLTVSVGLGTGNKDQQLMHIQTILMAQKESMPLGIATPKNIYNALAKLTHNAGFKNVDEFWTDPSMMPPQPPKDDPLVQVEKIKQQGKQAELQVNSQLEMQKAQAQLQQEQARSTNDVEIERQKIAAQIELERYKAEMQAQVALEKARIDAQAKLEMEQIRAMNQPAPAQVAVNNDNAGFSDGLKSLMEQQKQSMEQIAQLLSRPREIVRGPDGRAMGVK